MRHEEAGKLCNELRQAARQCLNLDKEKDENTELPLQNNLEKLKLDRRLAIMKSGAEKIQHIYKATGSFFWIQTRSQSPAMLAQELLTRIEEHEGSATELGLTH